MPKKMIKLSKSHREILRILAGASGFPATVSRAKLCHRMQMSTPGVSRLVQDLIESKIVVEGDLVASDAKIGRPQTSLALNERMGYFYTIHIDSDFTQLAIMRVSGKMLIQKKLPSNFLLDPTLFLTNLVQELIAMSAHISLSTKKIMGTGVTVGCQLDSSQRVAVAELLFWHKNVALYDILHPLLGHRLCIAPRLHALAQSYLLYSKIPSNHLYAIEWGVSIDSISILNKNIYFGENSSGATLAHYSIDPKGKLCHCGKRGCLQQYLAQSTLLANWQADFPDLGDANFEHMVEAAAQPTRACDAIATELLHQATSYLALSIQAVMSILNPEQILLFGANFKNDYIYHQLVQSIHALENNFPIHKLQRSHRIDDNANLAAHTVILSHILLHN